MERSLKGFNIDWDGRERVRAERETAPKHRYLFEVAADTQRIAGLTPMRTCALRKRQGMLLRSSYAPTDNILLISQFRE